MWLSTGNYPRYLASIGRCDMCSAGTMSARHLLLRLTLYYAAVAAVLLALSILWPDFTDFLPVGGAEALLGEPSSDPFEGIEIGAGRVADLASSILWLLCAVVGALVTVLPVTWTYIACRKRKAYDQALVESMIVMPIAVTAIVLMVQNSLALAFSLAGIVGAVRFRNTLKSTGDALFLLVAIAIGLSAGIGALEITLVMSMVFNFVFFLLWVTDYGGKHGGHRYLRESHDEDREEPEGADGSDAADRPEKPATPADAAP